MHEWKGASSPMEPGLTLERATNNVPDEKKPYRSAVSRLIYVCQGTRPDLAYSVGTVSTFNDHYNDTHWASLKRILRYLQETKDWRLVYTRGSRNRLTGYCGASWATDTQDPRSVTGYVYIMDGAAVSWKSRKQSTVAPCSTEAEYMSLVLRRAGRYLV